MKKDLQIDRATAIAVGLVVALMAGGVWWSLQKSGEAGTAERRLRMQLTQWRALAASDPAPVAAVAAELSRRVEAKEEIVQDLQRQLGAGRGNPVVQAELPASRADAFFAIAQFVERQQAAAVEAEVTLIENEAFGFSAHRNSGPADEFRGWVHRQMVVLDGVLSTLWTCRPSELLSVQREDPAQRYPDIATARSREGSPTDWMVWPESRSLRHAGVVDTMALRIRWVGQTSTLRAWFAQLGELDMPLVVRDVAVEPLESGRPRGGRRSLADLFRDEGEPLIEGESGAGGPVPLIEDNAAVFTVTLEYLDFDPLIQPASDAEEEML